MREAGKIALQIYIAESYTVVKVKDIVTQRVGLMLLRSQIPNNKRPNIDQ